MHISALLIVVLTLTGHSMAIARGADHSVALMEICTGDAIIMVAIDENGQPTGESHLCPEFSLLLQEIYGDAANFFGAPLSFERATHFGLRLSANIRPDLKQSARGPPLVI